MTNIKNILILIGPPGSGKGTQGKLLAPILKYNYLSLGQTLRQIAKGKDDMAKEIKRLIDNGHIIPDAMIRKIFHQTIKALPASDGLILDGFPRDVEQTALLDESLSKYKVHKVKVLFIDVPKAKVLERLLKREDARADDNPEVIHTRFEEYDRKTHPLLEYFKKYHWMTHINGDQSVEEVHAEIIRKLSHGKIGI